jgi:hypothetical protein
MSTRNTDVSEGMTTLVAAIFGTLGAGVLIVLGALWGGFFQALAIWPMYQWFIRSTWESAPDLNGWHLVGILMVLHLGISRTPSASEEKKSKAEQIIMAFLRSPIASGGTLLAAWVVAKVAGLI